jgi:thiol-disulfide isomerase/thioredoxin
MKRREFLASGAAAAAASWVPSASAQTFAIADFCVIDAQDRLLAIAEFRGRGLFLHWQGSWCPPCRREMPELAWLQAQYPADGPVAFVFMNAFEPHTKSRAWLEELGHSIAQYDSGAVSRANRG